MLSSPSCKAMDVVFSEVFMPAIVMLSIAVLISVFSVYKSLFSSY